MIELELAEWRRAVAELYASVRREADPAAAHQLWRTGRDSLFRSHPQSPLLPDDPLRTTGVPYWPYDPDLRFALPLEPAEPRELALPTDGDSLTGMRRIGRVRLPAPFDATLDVWWLHQYGGGLFLPVRDATAGTASYGGGRYLLDSAKGADLGGEGDRIVVDLNFLYHPSCRYDPAWQCPLAQPGNTIAAEIRAGERL
ncbi:MAG: hypothetical protein BGO37_00820 [Cellulomonas sp. 73-92]|uniref:DUF1684 domain-containing protein n=1 Tax=Cellulomonas sp. 73-92 TaxID=1895740 RepID=UPI000928F860|nr:DUF1684 domain-containing protein [Cellulomonas sp. 73-92]OJV78931.1 MAG: hypothetical protein BGO37_00820 [Cellulomonas sp. 73-92]